MRYQVPQFIEVEDKIFGPLTIKQFIYLAGGAGLSFIVYQFLNFYLAILVIIPVMILAAALAFYKINEKPFIYSIEAAFKYAFTDKLYIWKKMEKKPVAKKLVSSDTLGETSNIYVPKLSDSKLKDLSWSLDITENSNPGAKESMRSR